MGLKQMKIFFNPIRNKILPVRSRSVVLAGILLSLIVVILTTCSLPRTPDNRKVLLDNPSEPGVEQIVDGIRVPWGIDFMPDGEILVTDRPTGKLYLVDPVSRTKTEISGVPPVEAAGQGGLLDVLVSTDFSDTGELFLSYSVLQLEGGQTTVVDRVKLQKGKLLDSKRVFTAFPAYTNTRHYGSRLAIQDNYLFITVGDRGNRHGAQQLNTHNGKIIRIHLDGSVPDDNPFVGTENALPEIWSYGHRNPQGLAFHPKTGELWSHEHGPKGGDELNLIKPGLNYGWPIITHGLEYSGLQVGDGLTQKPGMEQPVTWYVPSIAPSGMAFYNGSTMPEWEDSVLIGALKLTHLNRLEFDGEQIQESRLLSEKKWRIREVAIGPDEMIYLGVDGVGIVRLTP